ncbi:MAG: PEP-utilizing enzyme [Candidatus Woesearchaeota archaeon]
MIDPNKELLRWGPIDGIPIYIEHFMEYFITFKNKFKCSWPDAVDFIKDKKTIIILNYQDLRDSGENVFKKYLLKEKERKQEYDFWIKTTERISEMLKQAETVKEMSDEEINEFLIESDKVYEDFWIYGFLPELSTWGGEQLIAKELKKEGINEVDEILEALSTPEELSFFQKEELELMRLKISKYKDKIKEHQKKYFWIRNSYGRVLNLPLDHFEKELCKVSEKEALEKIKSIQNYIKQVRKKKQDVISKYNVPKEIQDICQTLSFCIGWQYTRKKFIFIYTHIFTEITKELGKRNNIPFSDLEMYARKDILNLAKGVKAENIEKRKKAFLSYYHEDSNKLTYMFGEEAEKFIKPYIEVEVDENIKEVKGTGASKGIVKGKVCILLTPDNMDKMDKGDVLVAPMTSPDYVVAMRKACAVVTDEGGMTAHAAIVSRELGIPCIVGTRIATKLLKDGDIVEVDADNGIVRKV